MPLAAADIGVCELPWEQQ